MTVDEVLRLAAVTVSGDRQIEYGDATESFERIAQIWGAILGHKIEPWQVAVMMVGLKISRTVTSAGKTDNWVDMAGYSALGAVLAGKDEHDE